MYLCSCKLECIISANTLASFIYREDPLQHCLACCISIFLRVWSINLKAVQMTFISRKGISCKSLFYVIFLCLWLCESDGVKSGFKIYRSEHDIFTNLKCSSDNCTESQCKMYDAECYSSSNCKYCRCSAEGKSTFMISDDTGMDGECKRDEEIVPESGIDGL